MPPELFSGYGIRTLSTAMARYDPTSYHNGSVWPHDSAITVRGLMRYGFTQQAQLVASGLIDASSYFDGRLPELFCGFDRSSFPGPIPYPTSCSPQAWAAATPVSLVTSLLRVYPDLERGQISLDPALPPRWGALRAEGLIVGDSVLTVGVGADGAWEASASAGLSVRH
jgi:glycogen debranching enzyme